MKKDVIHYVVTDKKGNTKDERGLTYGYFMQNEKKLCEAYCKENGLSYKEEVIEVW